MTEDRAAHEGCACSKNRPCAFHRGQAKQMAKVAKPLHDKQKVEMGIEELRARYAKPEVTPKQSAIRALTGRKPTNNGWSK